MKTERLLLPLGEELKSKIQNMAKLENVSASEFVRNCIESEINNKENAKRFERYQKDYYKTIREMIKNNVTIEDAEEQGLLLIFRSGSKVYELNLLEKTPYIIKL